MENYQNNYVLRLFCKNSCGLNIKENYSRINSDTKEMLWHIMCMVYPGPNRGGPGPQKLFGGPLG